MLEETLFAGFGGQGVLLMGRLLAQAAMDEGYNATWLPSYGPEMRGGTANCIVVFSEDEVGSPLAATFDAVIAMNQPSLEKFASKVKTGQTLVINSSIIPIKITRPDLQVHYVAANDLAESSAGTARSANVVALGALHAVRPRLKLATLEEAIQTLFASKGPKVIEANLRALHAGVESAAAVAHSES